MKIIPKISIFLVIGVLFIMGAVSFFTVRWTQTLFSNQVSRMMGGNLDHIRLKIIGIEKNIRNTAKILSRHQGLRIALILGVNQGVSEILNNLLSTYPYFNYILIVEPNGSIFASSAMDNHGNKNRGGRLLGVNIRSHHAVSENLSSEMTSLSPGKDPFSKEMGLEGRMSQWHIAPVLKGGKIKGWIIVSYNWQVEMNAILKESANNLEKIGKMATALFLTTESGATAARSGPMEKGIVLSRDNVYEQREILFGEASMKLLMVNRKAEVYKPVEEIRDFQFLIAFLGVLFLILFLYAVMHRVIIKKVKLLHIGVEHYREGEFNYELPQAGGDELGDLARTFNEVGKSLHTTMEELKKEKKKMTSFKVELSEKMLGEQNITELSENITAFFCKFTGAHVGALYIANPEEQIFKFAGSYPRKTTKDLPREIKFGHGRCGQAALDKELVVFTGQPEDYLKIETSMGSAHPANILIFPVIQEGAVVAALEIGSFEDFTDIHRDFLAIANDTLANAISLSVSRDRFDALLKETRGA
ncbi:MAG: GAF domain-containing protein [Desulfobacterales bacterium]|nr:GAF domain-containing protein [Desulfobacterales bacterium]